MKISNICTPPRNIYIKKTLKTLFVTLLSIFLLSNTGTQVELPQSLPEVTVDANGKANMVINVEQPVSNAFQPDVQLAYNSNTENGFFGIGWQMPGLHTISRLELAGVHYDSDDRFISSLGGKMQKLTTGNYRNRVESESYNLFVPSGTCGVGPCQWTVTDKNGTKYYFGHTADSRIEALNLPPGKSGSIKIWALNKVEDPNGNFYTITYTKDSFGFYYPKTISYSDKTIEFTISTRSDTNIEYAENINLGMNKIVTGIKVTSAGETFRDYILHYEIGDSGRSRLSKVTLAGFKDLSLSYTEPVKTITKLDNVTSHIQLDYRVPFYNQAKCNEIKTKCDCSASAECRATAASYNIDVQEDCAEGVALMGDYCIKGMQIGPMIFMDDVDKDGKTDLIKITGGKNDNHISVAKITESEYQEYPSSPAWEFRINSFITTADIDGDGSKELWIARDNNETLKIVRHDNYVFNQVVDTGIIIDNISYDPNNISIVNTNFALDMNADGKTDLVMLYDYKNENITRFKIYFSNGTGFDSNYTKIEVPYVNRDDNLRFFMDMDSDRKPEWVTINKDNLDKMQLSRIDIDTKAVSTNDYAFHLGSTNYKNLSFADVNGDGKIDILGVLEDSSISVCLFTGDAFSESKASNSLDPKPQFLKPTDANGNNPNTFAEEQNTKVFADINGDRKADLITFNGSNIYVSYSNGNGYLQYDTNKEAKGLFQLADINADGKVDMVSLGLKEVVKKTPFLFTLDGFFVESMDINEYEPIADFEILFSDKESYDLVERITTNDGKEINIQYDFIRDVPGAVQTNTGAYPNLPNLSPDHLVTSVETKTGENLSKSKETYSYHDSKIHVGNNDEMGLLGFESTTKETLVITPEGEEKKVSTQVMKFSQNDPLELGKPAKITTYQANGNLQDEVTIQYEKVTTQSGTIAHRIKSQKDTIYENGNYFSQNTISYEYDANGNVTKETTKIEDNTTEVVKSYSPLNQVSTYTKKSNGVVIDNRVYTYTGANLSSSSVEIQAGKWVTTNFDHDEKGNITSVTNPIGQTTTISFNSNSQVTETSNHLGHTTKYEYDSKTGQTTKKTDVNGGMSEIEFDNYGRITLVKNPGEKDWSKKFIYSNSPNNIFVEERERIADISEGVSVIPLPLIGQADSYSWTRTYYDMQGKVFKKETSGKDGKVYTEDFAYDYFGRLTSQTDPYISGKEIPKYTSLEYNDTEGRLTKVIQSDGNEITYSYNRFTVTKTSTDKPTEIATSNALGQVLSQTIGDLTTFYTYNESGRVSNITEPSGNKISLDYDRSGNILTKIDSNSGKITYAYNLVGTLTSSTDARGIPTKYTYYEDGRLHKFSANGEEVEYFYDENQVNAKGKVTKIKDNTGVIKLEYDKRGNVVKRTHLIEDYEIKFEYIHDSMNRVRQIIYPDGTIVSYIYNDKELETIKMLPNDGKSRELKMLDLQYDEVQNKLTKTFGNGVVTEYLFDAIGGQLTSYKLTTGMTKRVEENRKYFYDTFGNITTINDLANPWKSQTFSFDTYNRIITSKGSYGERKYTYTTNGNLTQKGDTTMQYNSTDHANAVTSVRIPNLISSVTDTYEYDAAGYIHKRNNDTFTHDGLGRLSSLVTGFGEEFNYFYDYRGIRKKKIYRNKDEVTYYFEDGLYEIHVAPSVPQRYTLYVKNGDELIAQWTRTDAVLQRDKSSFIPFINLENQEYLILFLFFIILTTLLLQTKSTNPCLSVFIRGRNPYIFALSLISIILITCTKSKENFPFYAFTSIIGTDTPSVNDAQDNEEGGGGSGAANAPVEGLYFFHTDRLGSVTMLTNTTGEPVTGTSIGPGRSMVSYTPYGEIDRVHSGGPDIYRYKYTGQEEDKETGLYYYKARYYDPKIGRFLQPDTVLQTSSPFGTNQYMYVEGNPIMYNDPSGHCAARTNGYLLLPFGTMAVGAFGVAPGHNYTGGGGNCNDDPNTNYIGIAYDLLLLEYFEKNNIDANQQAFLYYSLHEYIESVNNRQGKELLLDKLNTKRKEYSGYLGLAVLTNNISPETALRVYALVTRGGMTKQPRNGVDRASYAHDYSHGSSPWEPRARKANDRWIKSAWRGARPGNLYDYTIALTGTVLFKVANGIGWLTGGNFKDFVFRLNGNMFCGKKGWKGCKL